PGGGEFTLIVRGSGFRQNSVVRFNNADRATTFFSGSELRAQIQPSDIASAGVAKVTVSTTGGGESTSLDFTITAGNPRPTIARLLPNIGAVGGPATNLNVFGTNFTSQSVIRSNGTDLATTQVSSAQLSATLPASALTAAGDIKISVFTPGPGGGTTTE